MELINEGFGAQQKQKKVALVTGGSSGIGLEVVRALAANNYHVVMPVRNLSKGQKVKQQIQQHILNADINIVHCDLASVHSIMFCINEFKKRYKRLDLLICNAGLANIKHESLPCGIDRALFVNHLSHFIIATSLLNIVNSTKKSRIVVTASSAHSSGNIKFINDWAYNNKKYFFRSYADSKLANVLFAFRLARLCGRDGARVHAVHPGVVSTNIWPTNGMMGFLFNIQKKFMKTPAEGARPVIDCALGPSFSIKTGLYNDRGKIKAASKKARDENLQNKLWIASKTITTPLVINAKKLLKKRLSKIEEVT